MTTIDLNCDLGEGAGHDAELMPLITSANIACGGHAGDNATMINSIDLAAAAGVSIGAHPGLNDRFGMGRRNLPLSPAEAADLIAVQVGELIRLAGLRGAKVAHVKPHGALYLRAARDRAIADAIAEAVRAINPALALYGLAGGELLRAGRARGLRVASEVFADRTYRPDGSLTPRGSADALITDEAEAVAQVLRIVQEGLVRATDGSEIAVVADTVCLHGDGSHALAFAWRLRADLAAAGIAVKAF
ncbi:MAG: 5-oxoprolinase subunit PxpA [Opitutaceae bacterium]